MEISTASEPMPALPNHESAVLIEGGSDMIATGTMDDDGNVGEVGAKPGTDTFPIVYKRRFAKVEALTDPTAQQLSPIVDNECKSADRPVVQRKAVPVKQLTLEQFWGIKPRAKLVNELLLESSAADEIQFPVQFGRDHVPRQTSEQKPLIKRKRVEKPLSVESDGTSDSDEVLVLGRKQMDRAKEICKAGENLEGELSLSASEAPNKKRRMGREGIKRGRGDAKFDPVKRAKLVLGLNRYPEVEHLTGLKHVHTAPCNEDGSSSGTETENNMPARIGKGQMKQQGDFSSEATESETFTVADADLPTKGPVSEEGVHDSDGEQIPIDLNALPDLVMSAKSRRKKQAQEKRNAREKGRRHALKRVEIHQQLQPLDQEKVVKSLWPASHGSHVPHDSDEILTKDGSGSAGGKQGTRHSSPSEETESDEEGSGFKVVARFPGKGPQRQSPQRQPPSCYSYGSSLVGKASGLSKPRRDREGSAVADMSMLGKSYTDPPAKITQIDAGLLQNLQGASRKLSLTADSSIDLETESDNEIAGMGDTCLKSSLPPQKPSYAVVNQHNSRGGKSSRLRKNDVVKAPESSTPMRSSEGNVGRLSVRVKKPTIKGLLSRKEVQRAKIIRSPQIILARGIESDRAVSTSLLPKKRKQKQTVGLVHQDSKDDKGLELVEGSDGVKGSEAVSEAPCSGFISPLSLSPNKTGSQQAAMCVMTPESVTPVKQRSKKSRIEGGEVEEVQGFGVSCKLTPRTRKLTDAMQKFVARKANRRQWREVDLSKIHPIALIGRSCKVYWPLDDDWYPGVIHDYYPQTKKHRIDYKDNEMEIVLLSKERLKLKLSHEEWVELEISNGLKGPDPLELVALATAVEDEGLFGHGELVWAKVKGYPMWPAIVMDDDHAAACGMEPGKKGMLPLQFFGSYDHCRFNEKKLVPFSKGLMQKFHTKCKRLVFVHGLEEVERYFKECRLPDSMAHLLDDGDGVNGAIERQKQEIEENWPEPDEHEASGEGRRTMTRKPAKLIFPLRLGSLTVLNLGKVVQDSEHFHDQQYIWPEGYTSIRSFPSAKDPDTFVDYKMQVLRNPLTPSLPLFRVSPADDSPVEGGSPLSCWKRAFQRLRKAHEKVGKLAELDKRLQFRSAALIFGFTNSRVSKMIQALPNARSCTKFTNWLANTSNEGVKAVLPPGYKPVDISWKHLDRCTVCYLDEEYDNNLLLQCDKCRMMVHMHCYGEQELPDGGLWLCNLCRPEAPKVRPPCCLCPVTGGAMKKTTDRRWAHLMCAMWIPETCLVDVKRMEPVDRIQAITKERWKLTCSICKVSYGACIQCPVHSCRTAFHPLCARSAGLSMEVIEDKQKKGVENNLRLLAYCQKHKQPTSRTCDVAQPIPHAATDCLSYQPPLNSTGCARSEPYNAAARRGRREPEALAAALAKRLFVENLPYRVTGCRRNLPLKIAGFSDGVSLWSLHWEGVNRGGDTRRAPTPSMSSEDVEVLSMSDKFRRMKSSVSQRLLFGKSAIHGMGVFTKQVHHANDMIIEYAGEVVRPVIADIRERRCYDSLVGAGTYMFRIDDERVIDATHAGSIAHLINHSCEPNCYSRTVTASGEDRIIIFAKRKIEIGEELTYDYRFMSKDEVLTCYCGCAGCRGSVNVVDGDEDPNKLRVPLSDLIKLPATTRGHTH